ncbi:hypothetical protein ACFL6S_36725, partial [Candidatus Poribacteria bacterium]
MPDQTGHPDEIETAPPIAGTGRSGLAFLHLPLLPPLLPVVLRLSWSVPLRDMLLPRLVIFDQFEELF